MVGIAWPTLHQKKVGVLIDNRFQGLIFGGMQFFPLSTVHITPLLFRQFKKTIQCLCYVSLGEMYLLRVCMLIKPSRVIPRSKYTFMHSGQAEFSYPSFFLNIAFIRGRLEYIRWVTERAHKCYIYIYIYYLEKAKGSSSLDLSLTRLRDRIKNNEIDEAGTNTQTDTGPEEVDNSISEIAV